MMKSEITCHIKVILFTYSMNSGLVNSYPFYQAIVRNVCILTFTIKLVGSQIYEINGCQVFVLNAFGNFITLLS